MYMPGAGNASLQEEHLRFPKFELCRVACDQQIEDRRTNFVEAFKQKVHKTH